MRQIMTMTEIKLTLAGQLRWVEPVETTALVSLAGVQSAFERYWDEGLFVLAAEKAETAGLQTLRYWQMIAGRYLTVLCHVPETAEAIEIAVPGEGELSSWLLTAPPMTGGEYLSVEVLRSIWAALDGWVHAQIKRTGDLKTFLQSHAPKWHQVGRVCFHAVFFLRRGNIHLERPRPTVL